MERYTASNSLPKVLYFVSDGCKRFEKKDRGCQVPFMYCWSMAQTAIFEASVIRLYGAVGTGWQSKYLVAKADLTVVNAVQADSER